MTTHFNVFTLGKQMVLIGGLAIAAAHASAANLAFDSASDSVYDDGWQSGDNGGSGFGAWKFLTTSATNTSAFVASSTNNGAGVDGNADGDIDDASGRSWGLNARFCDTILARRPLTGGALEVGQTVEITFDNGWIDEVTDTNGDRIGGAVTVGVNDGILNFFNAPSLQFGFLGGDNTYFYQEDLGLRTSTTIGFSDEGFRLSFTLVAQEI